ncbi:Swarming motility regulation sensor protein RssA [compost metagenome]
MTNTRYGSLQTIESEGRSWTSRTLQSGNSDVEVTLITPAAGWNFFIYLNSRGYYILPLLVCIPFLLFPAWLSIRIAMRPWNKVVNEIALRTPEDLSPLKSVPKHLELHQMVDAINAFLARLRESTERERIFIADAAHELRTPLAAMRINVEALQSYISSESQQELLAGIIRSNSRAARLVNQLLLLMHSEARIDTAMEPVPLTTLIQERMAELVPLAAERRIELEFYAENEIWITGVRERLMSLIDNVIENAVKYSPEGGRVEVVVRSLERSTQLRVSDAGPGILPEMRERVFDRFFRDPNQIQSGSGLGLAIVKAVAQQHNSSVSLSTSEEGGLMVTVDFPTPKSV